MSNVSVDTSQSPASTDDSTTEAYQSTQYLLRRITPSGFYYRLRTFSRQHPALFLPFARWRWTRWRAQYCPDTTGPEPAAPHPLDRDTKIVIEAYPRSGNTFAHVAFKFAQPQPVKIGHHTHAAAHLIAAARRGMPALAVARAPEDAVISYLIGDFDPNLSMRQAIREYIAFYGPLLPYRDKIYIATFEELTTDFGAVIRQVNQRFGTDFTPFEHTEANVERCFELIDAGYELTFGPLSEKVVSRPAESRQALKQELREQYRTPELADVRDRAQSIFDRLSHRDR